MSSLKDIISGQSFSPPVVLLYGPPGVGKTTFAGNAPAPIFIQTEDGANVVGADRFPLAESYDAIEAQLGTLVKEDHDLRRWSVTAWRGWKALGGPRAARFRL